jgi:hypothetical protein
MTDRTNPQKSKLPETRETKQNPKPSRGKSRGLQFLDNAREYALTVRHGRGEPSHPKGIQEIQEQLRIR